MLTRNRKLYIQIASNEIRTRAPSVGTTDRESSNRAGSRLFQLMRCISTYEASPALDAPKRRLFSHHKTLTLLTLIPN